MAAQNAILRLDPASPVPHYRQIVDCLRAYLVDGDLAPGDVLPSVRRVALELGITFNTVAQAYRQLAAEGWLDLKHGRRAVVRDRRVPSAASGQSLAGLRQRIRELVAQMRADGCSPSDIASELRLVVERLAS